ncbi:NAD(P)H-dependent oxidoreductase [Vibrio crassostreae]|uniref:NAD(P)H-dependent oxidoreductase n=1 Tax=Vibrio crassostreae TaxID=246167 RepID=UPI0002D3C41F|nr:NAD(P)H-dependent oxidoreductase [Vibrio crassostreae]OEE86220.1 NADPH quinone reductase MdaB [Vibrio crassostreae 9ZC88]
MSNVLIVNGGKKFAHSAGALNNSLVELAETYLTELNHSVKVTEVDNGYDIETEIEKWLWSDVVIHQNPAWWMGTPWIVKKYIDDVFTIGHGRLYQSDGRTRSDNNKNYGSGGLIQGKKYMLSVTWNAPKEAFTDPSQFFEGVGVDGVYLPFHKAHQFLGMTPLETFICNDVIKNPNIDGDFERYKSHLQELFSE